MSNSPAVPLAAAAWLLAALLGCGGEPAVPDEPAANHEQTAEQATEPTPREQEARDDELRRAPGDDGASRVDWTGEVEPIVLRGGDEQEIGGEAIASCGTLATDVLVRDTEGATCSTFAAEISGKAWRCTDDCDRAAVARAAVQASAAECSAWCSRQNCGTATFFPNPNGCDAYQCFETEGAECEDPDCPRYEYCIDVVETRVWNCFCRDLIPS